jgi:hypothetical protein
MVDILKTVPLPSPQWIDAFSRDSAAWLVTKMTCLKQGSGDCGIHTIISCCELLESGQVSEHRTRCNMTADESDNDMRLEIISCVERTIVLDKQDAAVIIQKPGRATGVEEYTIQADDTNNADDTSNADEAEDDMQWDKQDIATMVEELGSIDVGGDYDIYDADTEFADKDIINGATTSWRLELNEEKRIILDISVVYVLLLRFSKVPDEIRYVKAQKRLHSEIWPHYCAEFGVNADIVVDVIGPEWKGVHLATSNGGYPKGI